MRLQRMVGLAGGLILGSALTLAACGDGDEELVLATTTSTQDSGLLDVLVPIFEDETDVEVKVIAVGSGAALEMARTGDADAVLAHAPSGEQELVDAGDVVERTLVMHNDFVLVGPEDDPAGIAGSESIGQALAAIDAAEGVFISRGDDSGTHRKELELWEAAGIDPVGKGYYQETGQGMGETLTVAREKEGYTLTDRATFLALRDSLEGVVVLHEGDAPLLNIYHVMAVNEDKHDKVNGEAASAFVEFMVSEETQAIIGDFKRAEYGQALFVADAGKSVSDLGK